MPPCSLLLHVPGSKVWGGNGWFHRIQCLEKEQLLVEKLTFVPGSATRGWRALSAALEGLWQVLNPQKRVQAGLGGDAQRAARVFKLTGSGGVREG